MFGCIGRADNMFFKRKAYDRLLEWKEKYADHYSILLEGPRRVGKSTIAESFAKNEYDSYILIDFASASKTVMSCFDDLADIDMFFLRLQAVTGVQLVQHQASSQETTGSHGPRFAGHGGCHCARGNAGTGNGCRRYARRAG